MVPFTFTVTFMCLHVGARPCWGKRRARIHLHRTARWGAGHGVDGDMRPIVTYIAARCINCGADPGGGGCLRGRLLAANVHGHHMHRDR